MVFQSYALYPHMTAAENMGFSLKMRKKPAAEIRRRVNEVADTLGLAGMLDRRPRHLSGGERQRVAMGRAIVREPQVFLFDEPLSNLDATLRVQMRAELKQLHRDLNATTIFVTHDQIEAMTMADRIVVLRSGVVEQMGNPIDVYDRPSNLFVAAFIGSPAMNMISGRVVSNGGPTFVSDGGVSFPLVDVPDVSEGQPVVCGIRPEHFEPGMGKIEAEVLDVEPTGSETLIHARVAGHEVVALFRERLWAEPGHRIRFAPNLSHIHLFDAKTGRRLD
jgi:multiple sugar transport system ATP-binding protein